MKAALSKGVADGVLLQVKSSYKLSKEAKKPPKVVKAKKAVVKKVAPKKKVSEPHISLQAWSILPLTLVPVDDA